MIRTKEPLYRLWIDIRRKCYNTTCKDYANYGARGIRLYSAWLDFEAFNAGVISEIGHKPGAEYSMDRIDNDRGYEPGNIRWATKLMQVNNRRKCVTNKLSDQQVWQIRKSKYGGRVLSKKFGIASSTATRIRNGKRKSYILGPSCSIV